MPPLPSLPPDLAAMPVNMQTMFDFVQDSELLLGPIGFGIVMELLDVLEKKGVLEKGESIQLVEAARDKDLAEHGE